MERYWTIVDANGNYICRVIIEGVPKFYAIYRFDEQQYSLVSIDWQQNKLYVTKYKPNWIEKLWEKFGGRR